MTTSEIDELIIYWTDMRSSGKYPVFSPDGEKINRTIGILQKFRDIKKSFDENHTKDKTTA